MGIKSANKGLLVVLRCLYATARSVWRAPWQVSGHLYSGAKPPFLFQNSDPFPPRFLREIQTAWSLRRGMVWVPKTSLAAEWPICGSKRSGRIRLWRQSCNAKVWTSAACRWHAWNGALPKSAIQFLPGFKRSFAFPSSVFFHRKFRIRTRTSPNVSLRPCPILILQRNPGANAKS